MKILFRATDLRTGETTNIYNLEWFKGVSMRIDDLRIAYVDLDCCCEDFDPNKLPPNTHYCPWCGTKKEVDSAIPS